MATVEEFADSTDWLNTPLAGLAPLESALRCQVCKDFFATPMITSCSHTFCSLCIRRYLSQEGKCPACREADQEMKLRRNWAVEELVAQFTQARKGILDFAKSVTSEGNGESSRPKKRRKVEQPTNGTERRSTRSQARQVTTSQTSQDLPSTQEEVPESDDNGSIYQVSPQQSDEAHDGLVECPCCHRRMKEAVINSHLDRCISGQAGSTPSPSRTPTPHVQPGSIAYSQTKPQVSMERLPTINYSLLNDNLLRKKLRELGIPSTGTKELMRKRHTEWVNLWNANSDSQWPKTKRDLLRELDVWERTLGRPDRGATGVMVKEFDRDQWQKSNKNDFDDLIKKAREKRLAALAKEPKPGSTTEPLHETQDHNSAAPQNSDAVSKHGSEMLLPVPDVVQERYQPAINGHITHEDDPPFPVNGSSSEIMPNHFGSQGLDPSSSQFTMNQRTRMFE